MLKLYNSLARVNNTYKIFHIQTEKYACVNIDGNIFTRKVHFDKHGFYIVYKNNKYYLDPQEAKHE